MKHFPFTFELDTIPSMASCKIGFLFHFLTEKISGDHTMSLALALSLSTALVKLQDQNCQIADGTSCFLEKLGNIRNLNSLSFGQAKNINEIKEKKLY